MPLCQYPDAMEKNSRAATSRDSEKYIVRFPEGMRGRVTAAARSNNRSINAEIIARLEHSLSEEGNIRAGALDLNGLLSAGMLLAAGENKDDPAIQSLIARAKDAALRLARLTHTADSEAAAVDAKK